MIRSTKKEVKQAIREYLLDNMDFSGYGLDENEMTATEKIRKCYDIFKEEKGYEIPRVGERQAFIDWLQGLASTLTVAFYYDDQRRLLGEWLHNTPVENAKYDDLQVSNMFWWLCCREFFAMLNLKGGI